MRNEYCYRCKKDSRTDRKQFWVGNRPYCDTHCLEYLKAVEQHREKLQNDRMKVLDGRGYDVIGTLDE